jgi:hypothetical protein
MVNRADTVSSDAEQYLELSNQLEQLPCKDSNAKGLIDEFCTKFRKLLPNAARKTDTISLSDKERAALFDGLRATLAMKENCEGAPDMSVIKAALMKNPSMMFNLKRLQDGGAKLVVTGFQADQYVEFADAAQNLDIRKQEAGLAGLTEQERNDAIETIVDPIVSDAQKASAKDWLSSQLRRSGDARGLNFAEALVHAVAHGGTLISHGVYAAMAKRDPSVSENNTWTWYLKSLSDVMASGIAPFGIRFGGGALRNVGVAGDRVEFQGGRVAGLRIQFA